MKKRIQKKIAKRKTLKALCIKTKKQWRQLKRSKLARANIAYFMREYFHKGQILIPKKHGIMDQIFRFKYPIHDDMVDSFANSMFIKYSKPIFKNKHFTSSALHVNNG